MLFGGIHTHKLGVSESQKAENTVIDPLAIDQIYKRTDWFQLESSFLLVLRIVR